MTVSASVLLLSVALGSSSLEDSAAGSNAAPNAYQFSIKADLGSADTIDKVLAEIAEPVDVRLTGNLTPAALLEKICGSRAPREYEIIVRDEAGGPVRFVRYRPCLRQTTNRMAKVTPGDTLEAIAVRFGMRPSSVGSLNVRGKAGATKGGQGSSISPGDTVVAASAPAWTSFTVRADKIGGRSDLAGRIARAIGCGDEEPDPCLTKRSILLVEDKPIRHDVHDRVPAREPGPGSQERPGGVTSNRAIRGAAVWHAKTLAAPSAAMAATALVQPSPDATPDTAPVDPAQWPSDGDLVTQVLKDAARQGVITPRIFIGVAENGLADKYGRPLPIAAFIGDTADYPNSNGEDDDGNSYVDDWIGAGVLRGTDELAPSGDVSLCPTAGQIYSSWQPSTLQRMSHGSVVASIAAGGTLPTDSALSPILPRIVFFRMAKRVCGDADDDGSSEREAIAAADYLILRGARVLNLSFFSDGIGGEVLRERLISLMTYDPPLLVLPAGNYISENLDLTGDCPACLGNPTRYSETARLTLIAGSATRDRRIADYSGYGVQTVKIFAPGEPIGSMGLTGQPGDTLQPATSYSAPRVSFAGGLVQALGIREIPKVRSRLMLSVWPLHPDSRAQSDGATGILDLVKVAAVRHHAVEVVRAGPGGGLMRRTFVGKITGGLQGACQGYAINEAAIHAVRFDEAEADGSRKAHITLRQVDPTTREPRLRVERCQSSGALQLDAIRDGRQSLDLASVRLILFRGQYP